MLLAMQAVLKVNLNVLHFVFAVAYSVGRWKFRVSVTFVVSLRCICAESIPSAGPDGADQSLLVDEVT